MALAQKPGEGLLEVTDVSRLLGELTALGDRALVASTPAHVRFWGRSTNPSRRVVPLASDELAPRGGDLVEPARPR